MLYEVAFPQRFTVDSEERAVKMINANINLSNIYFTIYKFERMGENGRPDYNSAVLDRIFFDFDREDCVEHALRLHGELKQHDVTHELIFSGRGMHVIVYISKTLLRYKKEALLQTQKFFMDKLKLHVDPQTLGRLAGLRRIPGTFNFKAKRFCIYVSEEELNKGYDYVASIASKQRTKRIVYGSKLLNIQKFDKPFEYKTFSTGTVFDATSVPVINGGLNIRMPPFLYNLVKKDKWNKEMGWTARRLLILWIREHGVSLERCVETMKEMLSKEEYAHCISEVPSKKYGQISYIYERSDPARSNFLQFPRVTRLMAEGFDLTETDVKMIEELYI